MRQQTGDGHLKQTLMRACGFSDAEVRVYLATLRNEKTTVRDIAKYTGMHRTSLYEIIKRLTSRGALGQIRHGRCTYIIPTDPTYLLEERRADVDALAHVVPKLKELFTFAQAHHIATTYTGRSGLKAALQSISAQLKKGDELLIFGDGDAFSSMFPGWATRHAKERVQLGIRARFILRGSEESKASVKRSKQDAVRRQLMQIRVLPEAISFREGGFDVFGDTVVFYSYTEEPHTVLIRNDVISALMRGIFEMLWNYAEGYTNRL